MNIRGHHLLCIPRFKGGGYDRKFGKNLFKIQKRIRKNPNIKIKIIKSCDEVCRLCPYNSRNKCSKKPNLEYLIRAQDKKVIRKLGIRENKRWKARSIFGLSIEKIKNKELKKICGDCEFLKFCLKYGLNQSFVNDLKK